MVQGTQAQVAIIGGGIGGLTAAAALLRTGFEVQVYEQARSLGEVGAGINIGPNASRILHRLGIAEELGRTGVKPVTFDQRRWDDGRLLLRSPLGEGVETAFGQSPRIQVAIIAGLMMPRRSRRSITLNVSDCTEPFSAAQ
jgi:salicylate hydroxylase